MAEEKPEERRATYLRTCKRCGKAFAALSILFLVPVVRRVREHRHERQEPHRRFPIFGH